MTKYRCSLFFNYEPKEANDFFLQGLNNIGFQPEVMQIYINNDTKALLDIKYDPSLINSYLSKEAPSIQIQNKIYDISNTEDFRWFKKGINFGYQTNSLVWFHNQLDFLLEKKEIHNFIKSPNFIFGYCCDSYDNSDQTNTDIEYFKTKHPEQPYEITKDHMGWKILDTSQNWGRSIVAGGIEFVVAPLMWFGDKFYRIIPKEKIISFDKASIISFDGIERLQINLFDLYDDPAKKENRGLQRKFWDFFDFKKTIENFNDEREDEIGITDFLNEVLGKKNKKKT
jgi:hypothetical protein